MNQQHSGQMLGMNEWIAENG